jgi:hypothetical protein
VIRCRKTVHHRYLVCTCTLAVEFTVVAVPLKILRSPHRTVAGDSNDCASHPPSTRLPACVMSAARRSSLESKEELEANRRRHPKPHPPQSNHVARQASDIDRTVGQWQRGHMCICVCVHGVARRVHLTRSVRGVCLVGRSDRGRCTHTGRTAAASIPIIRTPCNHGCTKRQSTRTRAASITAIDTRLGSHSARVADGSRTRIPAYDRRHEAATADCEGVSTAVTRGRQHVRSLE